MATRTPNARALLAAAILAAVVLAAVPGVSAPSCSPGAIYCVGSNPLTAVECDLTDTTFDCTLTATYDLAATTATPLPGEMAGPIDIEIGICNGAGLCDQTWHDLDASCSWDVGDGGCSSSDIFAVREQRDLRGCLYAWIYVTARASAGVVESPVGVRSQTSRSISDFSSCD